MATSEQAVDTMLKDLRKKRGFIKGRLTSFKKYVLSFEDVDLTVSQRAELKLRISGAQRLLDDFDQVQGQIEDLCLESDIETSIASRVEFEKEYYVVLAMLDCIINAEKNEEQSVNRSLNCSMTHDACCHVKNDSVKLPTISVPSFDGSLEHWVEFRDTFISLIHNAKTIPDIQKFHYLKASLKGDARVVIENVEFSSDNYHVAWDLMLHRFNNTRLIIQSHIKAIFSIQPITKESPIQLNKLIDTILKNLRTLKLLGEPTEYWDTLIIYMVVSKLDHASEREWEQYKNTFYKLNRDKQIHLNDLLEFLKEKADLLTTLTVNHNKTGTYSDINKKPISKIHCNMVSDNNNPKSSQIKNKTKHNFKRLCLFCNDQHQMYSCQKFIDLDSHNKLKFIKDKNLCINCMRLGHTVATCVFGPCRKCDQKHNSLICDAIKSDHKPVVTLATYERATASAAADNADALSHSLQADTRRATHAPSVHNLHSSDVSTSQLILLSTAIVDVRSAAGEYCAARVILDSGSERSFITQSFCKKLYLRVLQSTQHIYGVGNSVTNCSQSCNVELKSRDGSFTARVQCLVLSQITSKLPNTTIDINNFIIPDNLPLADPNFYDSQSIDLLLGADVFWELIIEGKIRLKNGPYLQNTKLGWIVSGVLRSNPYIRSKPVHCNFITQSPDMISLDRLVKSFWELEELPVSSDKIRTKEETACEEHFIRNTERLSDGRFCVRLPLKKPPEILGETRAQAERRFYALEKRLQQNPVYKKLYSEFIHEYLNLGHMSLVSDYGRPHYFLPHHGVFREHAVTTKLRVVFDAGMTSSSGQSLNDLQMIGSAIQGDLISILLRFREKRYVACADIEKFYRQIYIAKDQRDLQLILWRDEPSDLLQVFQLNTVTYGTASAPFLSCRCLKELAQKCEVPYVADTINNCFYVDDLIVTSNSILELENICRGTSEILGSACIQLRKWIFNYGHANPNLTNTESHAERLSFCDKTGFNNKTLGVGWNNVSDEINYFTEIQQVNKVLTKRVILSCASQIFDPLGLLSPIITVAKSLLQKCWLLKLEWDEPVTNDIAKIWYKFIDDLSCLSSLRIPRYVMCIDPVRIELHIFTDASQIAYGACAFIHTVGASGDVTVRLMCSKGKIAHTKPTTIPRLELCGALLGARLFKKLGGSLRSNFGKTVFWTDSTIVLGWLGMPINLLKPYVQNRTAEIHELSLEHPWRHVAGKDNPADLVSRGHGLDSLSSSSLWWQGPSFLHDINFKIPNMCSTNLVSNNLPEIKSTNISCYVVEQSAENTLFPFNRYSQYNRIKRAAAYMLRFIHNTRSFKLDRLKGSLSVSELMTAELVLARLSQRESFPDIFQILKNKKTLKHFNQLSKLNLFVDSNGIIRVGGRIQDSPNFEFNKKFPILISAKHRLSVLLFQFEHLRLLHAGPQLLLATLREMWWPIGGRNLARKVVHACVRCARLRPRTIVPIMGNLPQERLDPGFPFLHCGVDYAGPVSTLNRKGRGAKLEKSYICLFVCLVTRAVHLELVSDLSTDSYLLSLKRFISRRGKPRDIYSDNGKSFVGLMNEFKKFLASCSHEIIEYATAQNINFKLIPSYASHFGGLWEAGVKSCKHHLRRVVGNAHLTFEEFSTVLTQIEAVLNSRPLTPLSADPYDFLPLTPAHFLVGRSLTAPVSADLSDIPASRLTRYQRVEQIRQHFWTRWSKEYVSELQTRSKWQEQKGELRENMLVLIKDDHLPPLKWNLGRIIKTYPGKDGISRVADIRKADGIVRRTFSKICPLPVPEE